ncbi:hypothetical protein [Zoogloea sp.]
MVEASGHPASFSEEVNQTGISPHRKQVPSKRQDISQVVAHDETAF